MATSLTRLWPTDPIASIQVLADDPITKVNKPGGPDATKVERSQDPKTKKPSGPGGGFKFDDPVYDQVSENVESKLFDYLGLMTTRFDDLDRVGSGGMGIVYRLPEKRGVLKVTSDESEARAAVAIMKKPAEVLFKAVDVVGFKARTKTLYAIEQEELTKLTDAGWIKFLKAWFAWAGTGQQHFAVEQPDGSVKVMFRTVTQENIDEFRKSGEYDANKLAWLEDVAAALARAGITDFADLKASNVMTRGGRPVVIDVGVSKAPSANIHTIARVLVALADRIQAR